MVSRPYCVCRCLIMSRNTHAYKIISPKILNRNCTLFSCRDEDETKDSDFWCERADNGKKTAATVLLLLPNEQQI